MEQARGIIQARLLSRGSELVFADDASNNWWWLMLSPEVNAAKLMLTVIGQPGWDEDMPRLAQGLIMKQRNGAWRTTTANLMGSLALEKFAQRYEKSPLTGHTRVSLADGQDHTVSWGEPDKSGGKAASPATGKTRQPGVAPALLPTSASSAAQRVFEPWLSDKPDTLTVEHLGGGQGWATIRSLAAVPVTRPIMAGYEVTRQVTPVSQAVPGAWSRGDVYRVKIDIVAKAATTWAVLSDPVPAGATILGSGLGRDSSIASQPESNNRRDMAPSFVERSFESYRAYYEYLPQGKTHIEYTVRLNSVGQFHLPTTRIEALYQPDVYGEFPNTAGVTVQAGK
jgi:hypothetical protein